jgi:hypothetical protein
MRVCLSHYALRSSTGSDSGNYHPKNWIIEGSNDRKSWTQLDRRDGNHDINGEDLRKIFAVASPTEDFVRFVRFRLVGRNHMGTMAIMLGSWDLFGRLFE